MMAWFVDRDVFVASIPPRGRATGLVVIGAGGHAKVAIETARETGAEPLGCVAREPGSGYVLGIPVIGTDEVLGDLLGHGLSRAFPAVGANRLRLDLGRRLSAMGFALPALVSRGAQVSPSAVLGKGVLVAAGAVVNADARIGAFAIVNTRAGIDHDCVVGEGAHVAPGATLAGAVRVGARTLIGAGATVLPNVAIGSDVVLGGGSVAIGDVPDGSTFVGVPARPIASRNVAAGASS